MLHHNGAGPGVAANGGIYLPYLPFSTPPSMCIVFLENWDNPLGPGWGRAMLDELRAIALEIESGAWEGGKPLVVGRTLAQTRKSTPALCLS